MHDKGEDSHLDLLENIISFSLPMKIASSSLIVTTSYAYGT